MLPYPDSTPPEIRNRKFSALSLFASLAAMTKERVAKFRYPKQTERLRETLADYLQTRRESEAQEISSRRSMQLAKGKTARSNRGKQRMKKSRSKI